MKPNLIAGQSPLLLAQPHGGTWLPDQIMERLNPLGQELADTDWHISRLYRGLVRDVTLVSNPVHRYVIDANRGPQDENLYPGQNTTGLCPTTTFDGEPIYRPGLEPDEAEIEERRRLFHSPYHELLQEQLERLKQKHGYVILYDCHSIRSEIPYLFDGKLPDLNIGTSSGASCSRQIQQRLELVCENQQQFSWISNGRFKGGWTTRHYGNPNKGVHAVQMELAQDLYMLEKPPWSYQAERAGRLRPLLTKLLTGLLEYPHADLH